MTVDINVDMTVCFLEKWVFKIEENDKTHLTDESQVFFGLTFLLAHHRG